MPTLYDYLNWRGDLNIKQVPLNDIDALILSRVSYLPFDGIVPKDFKIQIGLVEANEALSAAGDSVNYIIKGDRALLPAVAACPRFSSMRLSGFINHVDDASEKQFSAMIIAPGDGTHFVSFRGTDDTMVGWKEDFNMSFMRRVPSQLEAVRYLEDAAGALWGKLVLGGHSKGGNLAVYAAAFCPPKVQKRVLKIYNYDGPGFHSEVMAEQGYQAVRDKIVAIVPQSSVVGLLLEHEDNFAIIHSSQSSFMQHDLYSWEVMRDGFIYLDCTTDSSRFMDQTLRTWLSEVDAETRAAFIDGLYKIITATGSKNLKEFTAKKWYEHATAGLKALLDLDEHTRMMLGRALLSLAGAAKDNLHIFLPEFISRGGRAKKDKVEGSD